MQTSQNGKNLDTTNELSKGPKMEFDYAPSLESTDIVKIIPQNKLFINGDFVAPTSGKYFPSINPATGESLADLL